MSLSFRPALFALLLTGSLAGAQSKDAPRTGDFKDDCCIELNDQASEPGDLVLATMLLANSANTGTAVAVKEEVGAGCSAYLGPIYLASVSDYAGVAPALRSGSPDRLLEQAVAWAGTGAW